MRHGRSRVAWWSTRTWLRSTAAFTLSFAATAVLPITVLAVCLVLLPDPTSASEAIYPLPIDTDTTTVRTHFYLALQDKYYDLPEARFAQAAASPDELALKALLAAIRAKDYQSAAQLVNRTTGLSDAAGFRTFVNGFHDSLARLNDLRVLRAILLPDKLRFVLVGRTENSPSYRLLTFTYRGSDVVYDPAAANTTLDHLVDKIFVHLQKRPLLFAPVKTLPTRDATEPLVRALLQPPASIYPGRDRPALVFYGRPLSVDASEPVSASDPPAVAFYKTAYAAWRARDLASYRAKLTPQSRQRLDDTLAALPNTAGHPFTEVETLNRHLFFLIAADPVYVLFSGPSGPADITPFAYDYVFRESDGQLRLGSRLRRDLLDQVLGDPGFQNETLKPLALQQTGQRPSKR